MPIHTKKKYLLIALTLLITAIIYWPGLSGGFIFDDFPNIVDNEGIQPKTFSLASLVRAALSSPSSDLSRPLASLSFAINYLFAGLDPYWMKLTNLVIHLLNGILIFILSKSLLQLTEDRDIEGTTVSAASLGSHIDIIATIITASWLLLPINLTAVLYIVQRMESLANLFVLLGLIGYLAGRRRMLTAPKTDEIISSIPTTRYKWQRSWFNYGFVLCAASITIPTALGVLAKETAVMLPFYAALIEWTIFHFHSSKCSTPITNNKKKLFADIKPDQIHKEKKIDWRIIFLFVFTLALPLIIGLTWLLPKILKPSAWITRDFTLTTRMLSEARIVVDYIYWTLLPTPHELSFYHDDFLVSSGILTPWTTLTCLLLLVGLSLAIIWLRARRPLAALGIALFLGCHLLTGTILPLELIYEHRNYFASFGLLLAVIPLLIGSPAAHTARTESLSVKKLIDGSFSRLRYILIAVLLLCWAGLTAITAYAWGNPLRLAEDLAIRAPKSPRAQYELGRTYIILSRYDPKSPFTQLAYPPLERAAALPKSSILPDQALIFMNSRMHLPLKEAWWNSLIVRLKTHAPTIQDESSLASLTQCARDHSCDLPTDRMVEAFQAALSHPNPSARLLENYGDYAWNVLNDRRLGLEMSKRAALTSPDEPAYHITLARMFVVLGQFDQAKEQIAQLNRLNYGGRLDASLAELRSLPGLRQISPRSNGDM